MKKTLILLTAGLLLTTVVSATPGRCSGGANCTACKNCRYCKHCSQQGGSCSVCEPQKYAKKKRKK